MMRKLSVIAVLCALLSDLYARPCLARETDFGASDAVWTAIIPDGFPGFIYTWRMKLDGTYREDGRDAANGTPIQPTLSGRWRRDGTHMLLMQTDQPFVFDGVVLGGLYSGTLYFNGQAYSRFCAAKGDRAPVRCDPAQGVAAVAGGAPSAARSDRSQP
jgi:hypothetical protein